MQSRRVGVIRCFWIVSKLQFRRAAKIRQIVTANVIQESRFLHGPPTKRTFSSFTFESDDADKQAFLACAFVHKFWLNAIASAPLHPNSVASVNCPLTRSRKRLIQ